MISPQLTSSSMVKIWKYILCELGRPGFPLLTYLFSIVGPSHSNQMRKWHMAPNWKGQSKTVSLQMAWYYMCMCAESLQSCPALCNPMDYSPPGSSVQGIVQARILEWIAISSSRRSSRPCVTPWTAACQASLSFTISRSFLRFTSIESMMPSSHQ